VFLVVVAALEACADPTSNGTIGFRDFRGRYVSGFESSGFQPCGARADAAWWWTEFTETGFSSQLDSAFKANIDVTNPRCGSDLYLEVRGFVRSGGGFGHLNASERQLMVLAVRRVSAWSTAACSTR